MDKLVLGVATLALSAGAASAQGYGYDSGYAAPVADLAAPAYGYGYGGYGYGAPAYGYAAPAYAAPATAGTTVIIVTPSPAYQAPLPGTPPPVCSPQSCIVREKQSRRFPCPAALLGERRLTIYSKE